MLAHAPSRLLTISRAGSLGRRALSYQQGHSGLFGGVEIGKSAAVFPPPAAECTNPYLLDPGLGRINVIHHESQMEYTLTVLFQKILVYALSLARLDELEFYRFRPGAPAGEVGELVPLSQMLGGVEDEDAPEAARSAGALASEDRDLVRRYFWLLQRAARQAEEARAQASEGEGE